jgi:glycosyltransferase XagB
VGACIAFYLAAALLKLVITLAGRGYSSPAMVTVLPADEALPRYAVLLPVHKEANMLGHLVARVEGLNYPRQQLCILLLIEHDDHETLTAARDLGVPFCSPSREEIPGEHLRVLVIPPGGKKTRPNACRNLTASC